jgi:hypothetical protein
MGEQDPQHVYEELKKEHMRALQACDVEALQRVQEKLDKLTRRDRARNRGGRVGSA